MDIQYGDEMPDEIQEAVLRDQWANEGKRLTGLYRLAGISSFAVCPEHVQYALEYAKQLEDQIYREKPKGWWARLWKR